MSLWGIIGSCHQFNPHMKQFLVYCLKSCPIICSVEPQRITNWLKFIWKSEISIPHIVTWIFFVPQVRRYSGGDVTPTFNMEFFDWTDYEYMRPADKKQFSEKQGRPILTNTDTLFLLLCLWVLKLEVAIFQTFFEMVTWDNICMLCNAKFFTRLMCIALHLGPHEWTI